MRLLADSIRRRLDARFAAIRSLDPKAVLPEAERWSHTVEAVRPGGFLRWQDQVWRVEALHRYVEAPSWTWHELELVSLSTGWTTWLEWEKDDVVQVTATLARLPVAELVDGAERGLDAQILHRLVGQDAFEKEGRDTLVWRGALATYDDSGKATFFRDCGDVGEPVWTAEFTTIGNRFIALEMWDGGDVDAFLCEPVRLDAIEILSLGA